MYKQKERRKKQRFAILHQKMLICQIQNWHSRVQRIDCWIEHLTNNVAMRDNAGYLMNWSGKIKLFNLSFYSFTAMIVSHSLRTRKISYITPLLYVICFSCLVVLSIYQNISQTYRLHTQDKHFNPRVCMFGTKFKVVC